MSRLVASRSTCSDEAVSAPPTGSSAAGQDADATRPVTILAPRRLGSTELTMHPIGLEVSAGARAGQLFDEFRSTGGSFFVARGGDEAAASQQAFGTWLARRAGRDELTVAARVGSTPDAPGLGSVSLVRAVEAALRRMRVDCLDLVLFDGEDPEVPLDDTLATASWLRQSGKVRFFGAENVPAEFLLEARILAGAGMPHLQALAAPYGVEQRSQFEGVRQWAVSAQQLALLPTGTMSGLRTTAEQVDRSGLLARATGALARRSRVVSAVERVAQEHRVPPATIGVAWALNRRSVVAPIVACETADGLRAALAATAVPLTRAQLREMDRAAAGGAV